MDIFGKNDQAIQMKYIPDKTFQTKVGNTIAISASHRCAQTRVLCARTLQLKKLDILITLVDVSAELQ